MSTIKYAPKIENKEIKCSDRTKEKDQWAQGLHRVEIYPHHLRVPGALLTGKKRADSDKIGIH